VFLSVHPTFLITSSSQVHEVMHYAQRTPDYFNKLLDLSPNFAELDWICGL